MKNDVLNTTSSLYVYMRSSQLAHFNKCIFVIIAEIEYL